MMILFFLNFFGGGGGGGVIFMQKYKILKGSQTFQAVLHAYMQINKYR